MLFAVSAFNNNIIQYKIQDAIQYVIGQTVDNRIVLNDAQIILSLMVTNQAKIIRYLI